MSGSVLRGRRAILLGAASLLALAACKRSGSSAAASDEYVEPADLAKRLGSSGAPKLVHVGPRYLYGKGHIPGSVWGGQAGEDDGIARLRRMAAGWPRDEELVVYCGCCPMYRCPNVAPAREALKALGFTRVRALDLPETLKDDWTAKGYPVERGEPADG